MFFLQIEPFKFFHDHIFVFFHDFVHPKLIHLRRNRQKRSGEKTKPFFFPAISQIFMQDCQIQILRIVKKKEWLSSTTVWHFVVWIKWVHRKTLFKESIWKQFVFNTIITYWALLITLIPGPLIPSIFHWNLVWTL